MSATSISLSHTPSNISTALPYQLRPYAPAYALSLVKLFYRAIHEGPATLHAYTEAERHAWAPNPDMLDQDIDKQNQWAARFLQKQPWIAFSPTDLQNPLGFIELCPTDAADTGYIDCLYVDAPYQRSMDPSKHVARFLYASILPKAQAAGYTKLTVNASYPAQAFFHKQGFTTLRANEIPRTHPVYGTVILRNFSMIKDLSLTNNPAE